MKAKDTVRCTHCRRLQARVDVLEAELAVLKQDDEAVSQAVTVRPRGPGLGDGRGGPSRRVPMPGIRPTWPGPTSASSRWKPSRASAVVPLSPVLGDPPRGGLTDVGNG